MDKMQTQKPKKRLTFEDVWEMFQETDLKFEKWREEREEREREWEKERKEREREREKEREERKRELREWEEKSKKDRDDLNRQMKETDRRIGELGNRFGELAEHLVAPSIKEKFNELGFTFEQMSQNIRISGTTDGTETEVDILLENGDIVIVVEVKAKPLQKDIDEHIERIAILRRRADVRHDTRKFQGAIAGAIMDSSVRNYTHKAGFYVIEQSGDTVRINIPPNFKPREW